MPRIIDLLLIGTGITGLNAARQGLRLGLSTATTEALFFGGLVTSVTRLEREMQGSGSNIAAEIMMEVADLGATNVSATATSIGRDA